MDVPGPWLVVSHGTQVDVAKGAAADLPANAILVPHAEVLLPGQYPVPCHLSLPCCRVLEGYGGVWGVAVVEAYHGRHLSSVAATP